MTRLDRTIFGSPSLNQLLGIDFLLRDLDNITSNQTQDRYPPHNIIKVSDTEFLVELAVAGFSKEDLNVVIEDRTLKISGSTNKTIPSYEYVHKGISNKSFEKIVHVIDTIEVKGAEYTDGILRIALENVIPENKKPKQIPILGIPQQTNLLLED